jgi:hypothetical protein
VQEYDRALAKAEKAEERCSWWTWLQVALMVMFLSYTFAMWYASIHVAVYGASGGSVISVFFTVLTGGLSVSINPIPSIHGLRREGCK